MEVPRREPGNQTSFHRLCTNNSKIVLSQLRDDSTGFGVPKQHRLIKTRGGNQFAVGRIGDVNSRPMPIDHLKSHRRSSRLQKVPRVAGHRRDAPDASAVLGRPVFVASPPLRLERSVAYPRIPDRRRVSNTLRGRARWRPACAQGSRVPSARRRVHATHRKPTAVAPQRPVGCLAEPRATVV